MGVIPNREESVPDLCGNWNLQRSCVPAMKPGPQTRAVHLTALGVPCGAEAQTLIPLKSEDRVKTGFAATALP